MCRFITVFVALAASALAQGVFPKRVSPVSAKEVGTFQKQNKVALLVGISKYPAGSGLSPLNYAAEDVTEIGALLTQQGYTVALLTDGEASRPAIRKSLRQIAASVDASQSTILFYFSGHGYAVNDKYYLAPVSASDDELESEGLAVSEVEQILAASKAQRKLMMLDACRSAAGDKKGVGGRSISALEAASGFRILNSTKVGDYSYESSELHHGVFSNFVLQGLRGEARNADGLVTYNDLAGYVNESMRKWSIVNHKEQIPYEALGGEANGDFLLAGKVLAAPAPVAAAPPLQTTPSATANGQTDIQKYTTALGLRDPDQMDAIANTITTPAYADLIRRKAELLRSRGTGTGVPPVLAKSSNQDARAKLQLSTTRNQAKIFASRGNYQQALPLFQQAADAGDSESMVTLGGIYYRGLGVPKNYDEAFKWFQKAADLGEPKAMGSLGEMYALGESVPKNDSMAVQWNRKAAELGDPLGMVGLGYAYQMGRGAAKDLNQAVEWYKKAAALGEPTAQKLLRDMGVR